MSKQRNNKPTILDLPDFGKVPPQANDMEEAVLGLIMVDSGSMNEVIDLLTPDMFYRESHQKVFTSAIQVFKKTGACDLFIVTENLRSNNELDSVGGPVYLCGLTTKVISAINIVHYAYIIKQKHIQRELIRFSTELQRISFDDTFDISELLEYAETQLLEISGKTIRKQARKLGEIVYEVVDDVARIQSGEIKLIGIPSGFTNLDRYTSGFMKKELTILAARPSNGKTATAIQIAKNMALLGIPVAIFSCEMPSRAIGVRYLSGESGNSNNEIINAKCDLKEIFKSADNLQSLPIYIDDTTSISIMEIRAKSRRLIQQFGIKAIIADYLQLMKGEGDIREQEVSFISRGLKAIAKDLDIPVIALSQLKREVESRSDKKPMLSDLRESGAIEQDADVVIFLHCPEKYNVKEYEVDGIPVDAKGLIIPIIAKNRNGPTGEIVWHRNEYYTHIFEEEIINSLPEKYELKPNKSFYESNEPEF